MDILKVKANFLQALEQGWFSPGTPELLVLPRGKSPKGYREAAVLFLINKDLKVLITKRSMEVSSFKGHACLPGGAYEQSDKSLVRTALREAQEEVGLNPRDVEVVCKLPPGHATYPSLTLVTPVVAITTVDTDKLDLQPDPAEVDCHYWVPLQFFMDCRAKFLRKLGHGAVYGFDFEDPDTKLCHFIYGLTAFFCLSLCSLALHTPVVNAIHHKPYFVKGIAEDPDNKDCVVLQMARLIESHNTISKL